MNLDWIPFGFLPLYKPVGPTSHDMVARVRALLNRQVKVGHTGTLDPFASGVLVVAVGKATRFSDYVQKLPKAYRAVLTLGVQTDTLDPSGQVEREAEVPEIDPETLETVRRQFTGKLLQVPPVFSAKRVMGRRSYQLARRRQPVVLEPSEVTVYALELELAGPGQIRCEVRCSRGTYIRALGRDIAQALGTCGHISELVRTEVGPVSLSQCLRPERLSLETLRDHQLPVSHVLPQFPELQLPFEAFEPLVQGRAFPVEEPYPLAFLGTVKAPDGEIVGVFRCAYEPQSGAIAPKLQCFANQTTT